MSSLDRQRFPLYEVILVRRDQIGTLFYSRVSQLGFRGTLRYRERSLEITQEIVIEKNKHLCFEIHAPRDASARSDRASLATSLEAFQPRMAVRSRTMFNWFRPF
jgi:hypothetical protein